ncbi:hypothetical protein [Solirubrobacter soli]|uniref:hypothetical protein n=1 Tax=Solirubrobacter soli TaxID=363832 RepID=UPI0004076909|nr:hypothetical protein [Solirubrobacter soli]
MLFAAAGLSSLDANDFCNTPHDGAKRASVKVWPPGQECSFAAGRSRVVSGKRSGVGFVAILAAGVALVSIRRSKLAFATAATFGVTGLTALGVAQVPAFGFGWVVGGIIAFHFTRSHAAWMTAAAALAVGGIGQIANLDPWSWAVVLLALIAVPVPYDER